MYEVLLHRVDILIMYTSGGHVSLKYVRIKERCRHMQTMSDANVTQKRTKKLALYISYTYCSYISYILYIFYTHAFSWPYCPSLLNTRAIHQ